MHQYRFKMAKYSQTHQPLRQLPEQHVHREVRAMLNIGHIHQCRFHTRKPANATVCDDIKAFHHRQRLHHAPATEQPPKLGSA
jgi:DUF1680 family protein